MEKWKLIEGFDMYEVSNMGRVKRVVSTIRNPNTQILTPVQGKYLQIGLYRNGKRHNRTIHRLVAKAFIPNPNNLPEVNHKGSKNDNRASQLEWVSKDKHTIDRKLRLQQREDGASYSKAKGKWKAGYAPRPGKWKHIGYFLTREEAAQAHIKAMEEVLI